MSIRADEKDAGANASQPETPAVSTARTGSSSRSSSGNVKHKAIASRSAPAEKRFDEQLEHRRLRSSPVLHSKGRNARVKDEGKEDVARVETHLPPRPLRRISQRAEQQSAREVERLYATLNQLVAQKQQLQRQNDELNGTLQQLRTRQGNHEDASQSLSHLQQRLQELEDVQMQELLTRFTLETIKKRLTDALMEDKLEVEELQHEVDEATRAARAFSQQVNHAAEDRRHAAARLERTRRSLRSSRKAYSEELNALEAISVDEQCAISEFVQRQEQRPEIAVRAREEASTASLIKLEDAGEYNKRGLKYTVDQLQELRRDFQRLVDVTGANTAEGIADAYNGVTSESARLKMQVEEEEGMLRRVQDEIEKLSSERPSQHSVSTSRAEAAGNPDHVERDVIDVERRAGLSRDRLSNLSQKILLSGNGLEQLLSAFNACEMQHSLTSVERVGHQNSESENLQEQEDILSKTLDALGGEVSLSEEECDERVAHQSFHSLVSTLMRVSANQSEQTAAVEKNDLWCCLPYKVHKICQKLAQKLHVIATYEHAATISPDNVYASHGDEDEEEKRDGCVADKESAERLSAEEEVQKLADVPDLGDPDNT